MFKLNLATTNVSSKRNTTNDVIFSARSTKGQLGFNANAALFCGVKAGSQVAVIVLPGKSEDTPENVDFAYGVTPFAKNFNGDNVYAAIVTNTSSEESAKVGKPTGGYSCFSAASAWVMIGGDENKVQNFSLVPITGVQVVAEGDMMIVKEIVKGEGISKNAVSAYAFDAEGNLVETAPESFEADKTVFMLSFLESVDKQVRERKASSSEEEIEVAEEEAQDVDGFDDL
jgi:hypothetical protein